MTINDTPQSNQTIGNTQSLIRANFNTIDTAFAVDHVPYNLTNTGDQGKHNHVTFPVQAMTPTFSTNEYALYNAQGSFSKELFVHKLLNGGPGTTDIPFTESTLSISSPTQATGGWTKLPSGMIIITGSGNGTGLTTVTISQPGITQILMVVVSPFASIAGDANLAVRLVAIGSSIPSSAPLLTTQFQVYVSNRTTTGAVLGGFSFIALAYL